MPKYFHFAKDILYLVDCCERFIKDIPGLEGDLKKVQNVAFRHGRTYIRHLQCLKVINPFQSLRNLFTNTPYEYVRSKYNKKQIEELSNLWKKVQRGSLMDGEEALDPPVDCPCRWK